MPLSLFVVILIFLCANATENESDEFFDALEIFEPNDERETMIQNLMQDYDQAQPSTEKENEESLMEKLYQEFLEEVSASQQDMSEVNPKQLAELIEKLKQELTNFEKVLPSWAQTERHGRKETSPPKKKIRGCLSTAPAQNKKKPSRKNGRCWK